MPVDDADSPPDADALLLRRLEAELIADPARARRLARYTAQLGANPDGVRPPTGGQLLASAFVLALDAAVLAVAVRLNSGLWLGVAVGLFTAAAVPLCVPPPWARTSTHRPGRRLGERLSRGGHRGASKRPRRRLGRLIAARRCSSRKVN